MRWEKITLGEGAKFIRGITFKPAQKTDAGSLNSVVCLRTKNVQDKLDEFDLIAVPVDLVKNEEKFVKIGDTLVSSANSWNLVGKCCYVSKLKYPSTAGGFISILRANEKLNQKYMYRWFSSPFTQHIVRSFGNQTTNISNLDQKRTLKLEIPLPPLPEQKRIASILDAADALRTKRRQAIAMLDELLQATFLDMFGDPVTNPKGWEVKKLGDFVEKLLGGKNIAQAEYVSSFKVLKVSAVTSGIYKPEESKYLPDDYQFPAEYLVHKNDLLISRANTTELIGATAFVWNTPENIVLPDKIWKFVWKNIQEINPLFVFGYTNQAEFRRQVSNRCSGTSGSMKNIAKPKLLSIPIYVPPLTLQTQFASIVEKVEAQKAVQLAHLAELDTLFASLQQRLFSGAFAGAL